MTDGFHPTPDGFVSATFTPTEVRVLSSLLGEIIELLRDGTPSKANRPDDPFAQLVGEVASGHPPEDPVLARLLPSAYPDDDAASGEFRRFTEMGLRDGKVRNAEVVLAGLAGQHRAGSSPDGSDDEPFGLPSPELSEDREVTVRLGPDEIQAWLRTLTDLRLALATRLGVEQDDEDEWYGLPADDPVRQVYQVYSWMGFVQESLVVSL